MKRPIASVVIVLGALALSGRTRAPAQDSAPPPAAPSATDPFLSFDAALSQAGLARPGMRLDRNDMGLFGGDKFRLHLFDLWMDDPLKVPVQAPNFASGAAGSADSLSGLVLFAGLRLKIGVRRGMFGDALDELVRQCEGADSLPAAVESLGKACGKTPGAGELEQIRKAVTTLPGAVAQSLAVLVRRAEAAVVWRNKAFRAFPGDDLAALREAAVRSASAAEEEAGDAEIPLALERAAEQVDFQHLHAGAMDLALALDRVVQGLKGEKRSMAAAVRIPTALGDIVVGSSADDDFTSDSGAFLILDPGGNDKYGAQPSNGEAGKPVAIVVDLAGDDRYGLAESGRPSTAGAVCGYAFLVDCAGNDTYTGASLCQGSGLFGIGALLDKEGDDRYTALAHAQGAGSYGLGILSDGAGKDRYEAYQLAQGFGYVKGLGLLVDKSGDDVYAANDTDIRFPSAQTKEHNTSMCQGVGLGRRADYLDGHSLAGGIGMLVDAAGNDRYACGLFGQGCAYWYGVGLLADLAGDDEYAGVWYVQASCAHFAIGVLYEGGGNDRYTASMNMAQGAGHDFSLGFLIDESGNDLHEAPNLSLGGGNDNGLGIFWDRGGDDVYKTSGVTLGQACITAPEGNMRRTLMCLGVFVDEGGKDLYPGGRAAEIGDGKTWRQAGNDTSRRLEAEKGCGIDR